MKKPLFTKVLQIGYVVKDCEKTAKIYCQKYGIGPWQIYGPDCMSGVKQYGENNDIQIKVASTFLGELELELIEPLDNASIYGEFLQEQGEGLHHLALQHQGFSEIMDFCQKENIPVILSGEFGKGEDFAYIDARADIKCIIELYNSQPNASYPQPEKIIDQIE